MSIYLLTVLFHSTNAIFSIFNIVRIPNLPCTVGTSGGICYSPAEIGEKGYTSLGSCASGFGLCGTQIRTQNGESLDAPISYLQNPDYPADSTTAGTRTNDISVTNTDVCQIRLDFEEFKMDANIAEDGKCSDSDYMKITSELFSESRNLANNVQQGGVGDLCGINTGQHMYIGDFNSSNKEIPGVVAKIKTALSSGNAAKYKIKVTQIDCKSSDATMMDLRAPPDCRQFFRTSNGTVTSYNFGSNGIDVYEKNQDYKVCIRRQMGDCQITWTRTDLPAWYTAVGKNEYKTEDPDPIGSFYCYKATNGAAGGWSNNACGYDFAGTGCIRGASASATGCNDWTMIPEGRYDGSVTGTNKWGQNDIYCGVGVGWDEDAAVADSTTDGIPTAAVPATTPGVISQAGGGWSLRFHTSDLKCNYGVTVGTKHNARVGFSLDYKTKSSCTDTTLNTAKLTRSNQPQIQASVVEEADPLVPLEAAPVVPLESEDNVSLKQVLQELSWMKRMFAEQNTPGPISTTKEPYSRYDGWNRFPYEETPRNFFKNPPGIH